MTVLTAWPLLLLAAALRIQDANPAYSPNTERQKADALYSEGKLLEALPLYTELEKREPSQPLFAERRAAGLIAKSATRTKTSQQLALQRTAYAELLRAKALGDNSSYVVFMLQKLKELFEGIASPVPAPKTDPASLLQQGQAARARNDFQLALKFFQEAAAAAPASYEAALYTGETESRLHGMDAAAAWFSKAIAINPNRETAYSGWGDALLKANQLFMARDRFVDAVIAWPYSRTSWDGLARWAEKAHARLSSPRLIRPPAGQHFNPSTMSEDGSGRSAWLQYLVGRATYKNQAGQQRLPNETPYRHSLAEEVSCLQRAAEALKQQNIPAEKLDPSLNTLLVLQSNQMLEPWVLLHGADDGIVQDYAAYRNGHRAQLRLYIVQYDIQTVP